MIGLIIATVFVCIILTLLFSSLKITLSISDTVIFKLSYLGIPLFSFDKNKPVKKKKEKHKDNKSFTEVLKDYTKGKSRKKIIQEILTVLKELCVKFGTVLKHLRFKKLEFDLTVASSDAATTAIAYGNICSLVYSLSGMLGSAYNFDAKKIKVSADFASEQVKFILNCQVKIRIVYLVRFALSTVLSIIKLKLGEVKNGRT